MIHKEFPFNRKVEWEFLVYGLYTKIFIELYKITRFTIYCFVVYKYNKKKNEKEKRNGTEDQNK